MKKSAIIKLVLVSTVMASCKTKTEEKEWSSGDDTKKKVYMRSDTSAGYSRSHYRNGLMFFAFLYLLSSRKDDQPHSMVIFIVTKYIIIFDLMYSIMM